MTDPIRNSDEILAGQRRARAEDRAARQRTRTEALAELGLTAADAALFTMMYYGLTVPPSDLPEVATREDYNPNGAVTEAECRSALADCLAKGWLQVIDGPALGRIASDIQKGEVLGPVYGLPYEGGVDFTDTGAGLWKRFSERCRSAKGVSNYAYAYADIVHEKTARYFRTAAAAVAAMEKIRGEEDVVAVTGPTLIGPWRVQWWRHFPEGYRIDIEERRQWQGRASARGETCYFDWSARRTDPDRLQQVLNRHNVALAEWLLLQSMESGIFRDSSDNLVRDAAESASRVFGVAISDEQCREGLEACLRYGWLRVVDPQSAVEVRTLLGTDPSYLALPRTAGNRPGESIPEPYPASYWLGEIDFSPAGATLYRTVAAEWLGPDWEDALQVSRGYYWEEHHYCEAEEGIERIAEGHVENGVCVLARRVVPIGPWCVKWWDRFPAGFRLELELADP